MPETEMQHENQDEFKAGSALAQSTASTGHKLPSTMWIVGIGVLIAVLLPFWLSGYTLGILAIAYYYGVYAMSWDLVFGYAGDINFGPTVQIGLSAYVTGIMVNHGFPIWVSIIAGIVMALVAGILITIPALKLRGPYFGLMTLCAALLLKNFIVIFSDVTGGELGLLLQDILVTGAVENYWIALACMLGSGAVIFAYSHSSPGLILEAIGQDPTEAQALGFSIVKHKLFAFCISAVFSGLAGALMALYMGIASLDTAIDLSIVVTIIIAALVGGRRTIIGGAIGAILVIVAAELLRPIGELNEFVVALFALVVLVISPDGIYGYYLNMRSRHGN